MKSVFDQIFNDIVEPYLAPRIRRGSIKAVKGYLASVEVARKIAITAFGIGAVAGIMVTGVILMLIAIVGLLPLDPQAVLIGVLVVGTLMTAGSAFVAYRGFAERRWLKMSKSYELIEAALGEWDNSLVPPNPRDVMKRGQTAAPTRSPVTAPDIVPVSRPFDTMTPFGQPVP